MSEQPKHQPGPWFVSRDPRPGMEWNNHIASVAEPHLEICSMFHTNDVDGNATGEANARLVAAAPDLLALAKQYASECAACGGSGGVYVGTEYIDHGVLGTEQVPVVEPCTECADIHAVISKAERGA